MDVGACHFFVLSNENCSYEWEKNDTLICSCISPYKGAWIGYILVIFNWSLYDYYINSLIMLKKHIYTVHITNGNLNHFCKLSY